MPPRTKAAKAATDSFDPRVDVYLNKAPSFARPILNHLRTTIHNSVPRVTETIKWSRPFFILQGTIFCNISAFTAHCSFGFWSLKMTELLTADGIDGAGSSGSLGRITSIDSLPPKKVFESYLNTAAALVASGNYGPGLTAGNSGKTVKAPLPLPPELAAALSKSKAAKAIFDAFPPSCRREYIEWISSAKRPETRAKRLHSAIESIAGNRRMNDSYR